jgi:hypothetical protein
MRIEQIIRLFLSRLWPRSRQGLSWGEGERRDKECLLFLAT